MHHCTEGTENLNFFELKLLCPWLQNCANIGLFHLGCESAHTGRAICTDQQQQMWSPPPPFTKEWCGREWRQKLSLLIISLLGWSPLGMHVYLLPCRAQQRWIHQLARKMQVGKEVTMSCLESLDTITAMSGFWGRERSAVSVVLMRKPSRSTLSTTVLNVCITGNHKQKLPQVRNLH